MFSCWANGSVQSIQYAAVCEHNTIETIFLLTENLLLILCNYFIDT